MYSSRDTKNAGLRILSRRDGILILSLLLIALTLLIVWKFQPGNSGRVGHVIYEREIIMTLSLNEEGIFSLEQLPQVVFEVRDGRIAFISSDCPDQVCVHTGFIGEIGQFSACLPNHIAIRIVGKGNDDAPDAVA